MGKKNKSPQPKPEVIKEEVKVKEEPVLKDAIVDGVAYMLNIRSTPEVKEDNVVHTVPKGFKLVVVNPEKAKGDWYKIVISDPKIKGYAMKKYIKII